MKLVDISGTKEGMKTKIDKLESDCKNKSTRLVLGMSDFNKGYQPWNNIEKDEKGVLVTDSNSILAGWRNHLSQLFNEHGVNDFRQTIQENH